MGWISPVIQFLQKRIAAHIKIICCLNRFGSYLFTLCEKTIPSNAESHEEQDGSKQKFVGETMAKLWPILSSRSKKYREEMKIKDLNPVKEGDFHCKLR